MDDIFVPQRCVPPGVQLPIQERRLHLSKQQIKDIPTSNRQDQKRTSMTGIIFFARYVPLSPQLAIQLTQEGPHEPLDNPQPFKTQSVRG